MAGRTAVAATSQRKRQAITEAAVAAFLAAGYSRTSMDDIARLAAVSKQTVYKHFASKSELLTHVVTSIVTGAGERADAPIAGLADSEDLAADLRAYAREQLRAVIQPRPMQLRRLVIAEATTFPELGRLFYELGPQATVDQLAAVLARLHERGLLDVPDPRPAAADLNWLVMSDPLNRAMLLGSDEPLSEREIVAHADRAITTFLAAYGPAPAAEQRRAATGPRRPAREPRSQ